MQGLGIKNSMQHCIHSQGGLLSNVKTMALVRGKRLCNYTKPNLFKKDPEYLHFVIIQKSSTHNFAIWKNLEN